MFNNFPYTNFHNLNLDWIIKTVKVLFSKSVFSINGVEPDAEGNVSITGTELGAVSSVNGKTPVDGAITLTASDVGAIPTGQGVTKVNGFSPDSSGNVLAGTVRSVNGKSPASLPTPGSVTLTASDIGALPSTIDPVETVNGISPDANGNVNVGTVKSVNNSTPDANGNVNLPTVAGVTSVDGIGPDASGNVQLGNVYVKTVNGESPTNGNVTIDASDVGALADDTVIVQSVNSIIPTNGNVAIKTSLNYASVNITADSEHVTGTPTFRCFRKAGICMLHFTFKTLGASVWGTAFATGFPAPNATWFVNAKAQSGAFYLLEIRSDTGALRAIGAIPDGETLEGSVAYPIASETDLPIVTQ